uniref:Uncharacterized protein n=1 Tax=Rhizophora mucronata TaxID=61149 RepID=A0A2P2R2A5_RHIMU
MFTRNLEFLTEIRPESAHCSYSLFFFFLVKIFEQIFCQLGKSSWMQWCTTVL